jgi:hypothetical protein
VNLAQWAREKFEPHSEWYCAPIPFPLERHLRQKFADPDYVIVVAEDDTTGDVIGYMIVVDSREFAEWMVPDPNYEAEFFQAALEYGVSRWPKLWGFATPRYGVAMMAVPTVPVEHVEPNLYRAAGTDKHGELMAEPIIDTG